MKGSALWQEFFINSTADVGVRKRVANGKGDPYEVLLYDNVKRTRYKLKKMIIQLLVERSWIIW